MKFASCHNVDFKNCPGGAKIERENNLKEFKSAHDIDSAPKSGAGSEFGREQREEARRKKYGIRTKNYNPLDQPMYLKFGAGKQLRRFKGTKNGSVSENASYYFFTPDSQGKFVALPVDEWCDFVPLPKYKPLNIDEAEEEYLRRGKIYNHFALMSQKRYNLKNEETEIEEEKKKKGKKGRELLLSEFDLMSGSEKDEESETEVKKEEEDDDDLVPKKAKKKGKKNENSEDEEEANEEVDDVDEGQELDYISMSSGDDEDMYDDDKRDDSDTYKDAGVDEEEGLKKLIGSDDEDEENENKKEEKDEDDPDKVKAEESDSDTSDSDIDSNPLYDLLNPPSKIVASSKQGEIKSENTTLDKKGKADSSEIPTKKIKIEPTTPLAKAESTLEEIVKRYLLRKPTNPKDLLKKLRSKPELIGVMTRQQISENVAVILKRLKPECKKINGATLFYLKDRNS